MAKTKKTKKSETPRAKYQRERRIRIARGELVPRQMLVRDGALTTWASGLTKKALREEAEKRGQLDKVKPFL